MTDTPKTHAEVAKKLWKRLLDADVDACNPDCDDQTRGPVAILATALREAVIQAREDHVKACGLEFVMGHPDFRIAAPKGFVLDDAGNVRRVLEWSHNPLTNRIHAEIDVTQGEKP